MAAVGGGALQAWQERLERLLGERVAGAPPGLAEAMGYALLGPGKRLRPLMVLGAAVAVGRGEPPALAWRAAVAIECVHAYSLVHDDLPAMDDDDLRRGRPTVHRAYDEATAILAGDALQALAFESLTAPGPAQGPRALRLVAELASAAGAAGMVGGQYLDLRQGAGASAVEVREMHRLKTGALFRAACRMGALAAGGRAPAVRRLDAFGEAFGAMYQALDDLADESGDKERPSLVRALGAAATRDVAATAASRAQAAVDAFGDAAQPLLRLLEGVRSRALPA